MKVFSIIVIYNGMTRSWIKKCFDSLEDSTQKNTIVAVDNRSSDESTVFIKEKYPKAILIESNQNLGFGKANNIGIEYALNNDADFVFLLNQDSWIEENSLKLLVEKLSENKDYGILSPLHLNGKGEALDLSFSRSLSPHYCPDLYSDFVLQKNVDRIYEAFFVCAAAWLVSKDCLKKVGGFNPNFFHYAEDDNYVHRLHFKNLKIGVYPICKMNHDREDRESNFEFENDYYGERNQYIQNLSNPNENLNVEDVTGHLRALIFKNVFNKKKVKHYSKLLKYFKENGNEIKSNNVYGNSDYPHLNLQ